MTFSIVVATDINNGIGFFDEESLEYYIPWKNSQDIKYFKYLTSSVDSKKAVIMGRNTYNSLPCKYLPNRVNIVITSNEKMFKDNEHIITFKSLDDALSYCEINFLETFVIGGSQLYREALNHEGLSTIYWNIIKNTLSECNIFFPMSFEEAKSKYKIDHNFYLKDSPILKYNKFMTQKMNNDEMDYLNLLEKILLVGDRRQTRNSITYSLFAEKLNFDLKLGFPLLTSKKMFLRGIFEELMWILRGQTNSKILEDKGVNIWKANSTKEFLDSVNLNYEEGDIGNMYGFQLRHSGTDYNGYDKQYSNLGFDQVKYCLNLLKNDKFSRRIMMTTFSPNDSHKGVLYPCHGIVIQFYVKEKDNLNYLSCHMYQRSADMFLGVPFNIASYSLLVYMICHILNKDIEIKQTFLPDKLTMSFGDIHIYDSHIENVKEQIKRQPFSFPQIKLNEDVTKLESFNWEDIELIEYNSHKSIKGQMVA